jgi:alpha-tubulin suppressor-like RCC1 family protein
VAFFKLNRIKACSVSAGHAHTVAVARTGECYAWGDGAQGRLGTGDEEDRLFPQPMQVLDGRDEAVQGKEVACGDYHTCVITARHAGYVCGWGACGQLGLGEDPVGVHRPRKLELISKQGLQLLKIAAGRFHTLMYCTDGVYSCGDNSQGQLGHGDTETRLAPNMVLAFEGLRISQLCAGALHSAVLAENGALYTFGAGTDGCLGHNDITGRLLPTVVKGAFADANIRPVQVEMGDGFTVVLTRQGWVYSMGRGNSGQLGQRGNLRHLLQPSRVDGIAGKVQVMRIAAGASHTVVLKFGVAPLGTTKPRFGEGVYTWGHGELGQLGHGDYVRSIVPKRVEYLEEKPALVEEKESPEIAAMGLRGSHGKSIAVEHRLVLPTAVVVPEKVQTHARNARVLEMMHTKGRNKGCTRHFDKSGL